MQSNYDFELKLKHAFVVYATEIAAMLLIQNKLNNLLLLRNACGLPFNAAST